MTQDAPRPTSFASEFDVVVIGMGPVGKMIGLMLARAGHSVLLTERKLETYGLPRAVAHDAEIARLLQTAGMNPDSMPDAVEPYDDLYVWVNGDDEVLHEVDWRGVDPSGWNNTYFYNQPSLEAHLEQRLASFENVDRRRGVSAKVVDQDQDGVTVSIDGDNDQALVRAKYVIGADGANSATRKQLGIEWNDLGYFYDWLVVDIRPREGLKVTHLAKQVCDPRRPTTVVPGGPGRRRWEFMRLEGETVEELTKPERIWELLGPFGVTADNAILDRGVVYTFNSGWSKEWKQGRVFVVGDAAHLMPPFAGQGLAAGFRDCINLAWKLDLVLRGIADDALLDTVESERQPHLAEFIQFSMSLGQIICITDPEAARQRDESMKAVRASGVTAEPPPAPRLGDGVHRGEHGGTLSWQGRISTERSVEDERFDDVFGAGALIVRGELAAGIADTDIAALRELGIAVVAFGADAATTGVESFFDVYGTYAEWFDGLGTRAVLVRPDFYVFGTADSPAELHEVVVDFVARVRATTGVR
ncbi:hypothetical protein ASD65_11045 [Microbacterium sp. Root61]|uniref:bifunctional 3-(3-hydroxy-phenyl)propionate/3-hydroxycinnamic acid hydroxylase MhpA n=1 Tax=Microbacterium sp. Root61 TaxID=1736570 RepID=UPI0006F5AF08|nr:bifunctional 3-(3-hydroxy-phenyl)propionate/3-hydroxycinnamic acid hydroxylase [Microbacterium sp. Root61]KRA24903.1 hypothetical protein ASD65_11045 [Microbacterium sp. Root61]